MVDPLMINLLMVTGWDTDFIVLRPIMSLDGMRMRLLSFAAL